MGELTYTSKAISPTFFYSKIHLHQTNVSSGHPPSLPNLPPPQLQLPLPPPPILNIIYHSTVDLSSKSKLQSFLVRKYVSELLTTNHTLPPEGSPALGTREHTSEQEAPTSPRRRSPPPPRPTKYPQMRNLLQRHRIRRPNRQQRLHRASRPRIPRLSSSSLKKEQLARQRER